MSAYRSFSMGGFDDIRVHNVLHIRRNIFDYDQPVVVGNVQLSDVIITRWEFINKQTNMNYFNFI